jgi:hypothetical protein
VILHAVVAAGAAVVVTSVVLTVSALLRRTDTAPDWGLDVIRRGMR